MSFLKQSTARDKMVLMTDSADHLAGKTGLTLTITASKNGAAFASISPTVTERGNGWYSIALTSSHTDTLGDLVLHITGTGADPSDLDWQVVALLPGEAVTVQTGTGSGQLNIASGVVEANLKQIDGLATNGNNATLNLKQLNIINNSGTALVAESTGNNGHGAHIVGHNTGKGIYVQSPSGNGVHVESVGTTGMRIESTTGGVGLYVLGGSVGNDAMTVQARGTNGVNYGIRAIGTNNGSGIRAEGNGTGSGISAVGGATGDGIDASGGATSGKGIDANGTGGAADIEGTLTGSVTGNLGGNVVGNVEGDLNGTLAALSTNALTSILGRFLLLKDELVSTVVTSTTVTLTGEYSPVTNAFAGCVLINKASDTTLKQVRNIVSSQTSGGVTELTIDGTWLTNPIDGDTITIYEGGHPVIGDLGSAAQADISSAVWSRVIDGTRTSEELLRGIVAALLGKSSDHAAGTPKYRNIADTKDVISATTDSDGNRTAVTTDLT